MNLDKKKIKQMRKTTLSVKCKAESKHIRQRKSYKNKKIILKNIKK